MCDPEGGVCKRRLDTLQMQNKKAFETAKAAWRALREDQDWTLVSKGRPAKLDPLATFIEKREAIWVESSELRNIRASLPSLSVLSGIRSRVYGVTFSPGPNPVFETRSLLCLCSHCHDNHSNQCSFPSMSVVLNSQSFQVNRVKAATKAQLEGYLVLNGHTVKEVKKLSKVEQVKLAADKLVWTCERPEEPDALLQSVTVKLLEAARERPTSELVAAKPSSAKVPAMCVPEEIAISAASQTPPLQTPSPQISAAAGPAAVVVHVGFCHTHLCFCLCLNICSFDQFLFCFQRLPQSSKPTQPLVPAAKPVAKPKRSAGPLLNPAKRVRAAAIPFCPFHYPEKGVAPDERWVACVELVGQVQCPARPKKVKSKTGQ